ncbi:MAG: trimethylamine methyltransferase family protein [Anaerolineales bacterium]|nr:trimethylamine methyltransferase family protein [Anaerolineales bacterium]
MIITNYSDVQTPQFRVLSEGQCHELYMAALECLQRVGVLVNQQEARELLVSAGARAESKRVYIPPHIIQDALASTPRTFTLWGRQGGSEIRIMPDRVHFGPGPTCSYFYDPNTGERRRARRGDAGLTARVCDALENLDYVMSLSLLSDVTPMLSPVYEFAEMIANTTKPVVAWANDPATLSDIYQIAAAVAGGEAALHHKPNFAMFTTYESPLRHADNPIANLLWAARREIPIVYLGGPTVGLESPATGASAMVIYLATALSGLAIAQLKQRGVPFVIGCVPAAMDLRTARPAYGSPEMSLYSAAAADLARYLGVPFMGTAGASESKLLDSQAAIEISLQILASALSGASLVHDVGFLDCADIGSLELLVMSDEVIAMVKRMMRGLQVNQQTIMLNLIEKVGPGGHFLAHKQSASLCRNEIWIPGLVDRDAYVIWEKKGSQSMEARVGERLRQILATHQPPPLSQEAQDKIQAILAAAEQRYRSD